MKAFASWARIALFVVSALFVLVPLLSLPAHAATIQCAGIADMLAQLNTKDGEKDLFVGRFKDGTDFILTANPGGGTWTAVIVGKSGKACIGAAGSTWMPGNPPGPNGTEG